MSITEIIPMVTTLSHPEKFELIQILLNQIAQEEGIHSQTTQKDALWDMIGMAEGEETNVAQQHDKYLYS
jgi:hypothetical protein